MPISTDLRRYRPVSILGQGVGVEVTREQAEAMMDEIAPVCAPRRTAVSSAPRRPSVPVAPPSGIWDNVFSEVSYDEVWATETVEPSPVFEEVPKPKRKPKPVEVIEQSAFNKAKEEAYEFSRY